VPAPRCCPILHIPLALDEPVTGPAALYELLSGRCLSALALKVTRTGGLLPSRRCADMAEAAGLLLVSSGLTDAGIGFAANVTVRRRLRRQPPVRAQRAAVPDARISWPRDCLRTAMWCVFWIARVSVWTLMKTGCAGWWSMPRVEAKSGTGRERQQWHGEHSAH